MVKKVMGYLFVAIGLVILVVNLLFRTWLQKNAPSSVANLGTITLGIIAVAAVIVGAVFLKGKSGPEQASEEVPIYHGNKIVGYRKAKK